MRLRVLGPVELRGPAGETVRLGGRRQEVLLALLCAEANRPISAGRLIELMWPREGPRDPSAALYVQVSRLRRALAAAGLDLVRRAPGYMLRVSPSDLDALAFEALIAGTPVHEADPAALARHLTTAFDWWRAEPYLGLHDVPALRRESGRLNEMRLSWTERAAARLLAHGEVAAALDGLRHAVAEAPLRERSRLLLMDALAADGRVTEAVAEFHAYRTLQADETGLDPSPEMEAAYLRLLSPGSGTTSAATVEHAHSRPAVLTSVPGPLSPIVGREGEADQLVQLIGRGHRLVTLTGPGGVGKTRLAIEVAHRKWRGEAVFVDLSSVSEPEDVPDAFALAHGVSLAAGDPIAGLTAALGDRELLLLVDNFEQVIPAAGFVVSLLSACAGLTAVVTSRVPLGVPAEMEYPVRPLTVPPPDAGAGEVLATAAASLFVELAPAALAATGDSEAVAAHIGQLCRELGGLPLAIELAAALARSRSIDEVFAQVTRSLRHAGPVGGSAAPLAAAIGWSYERLAPVEQRMLRSLTVFRGRFDNAGARAVCVEGARSGDAELEAALDRMVSLGLLQPHRDGAARGYSISAIITAFLERRCDHAEQETAREAHFHHHAGQCRDPRFLDDELLTRVDTGYPDFVAALTWGMARPEDGGQTYDLAVAMLLYWLWRERSQVALRWLDRLRVRFGDEPDRLARADVLHAGFLRNLGRVEEAAEVAARGTARLESAGDGEWSLTGYAVLSAIADSRGDAGELVRCAEAAVRTARADVPRRLAEALGYLAYAYAVADNPQRAAETAIEALALIDDITSLTLRAGARVNAAQALVESGHGVVALEVLTSGLRELRRAPEGMPGYWLPLGWGHLAIGDDAGALRWFRRFIDQMAWTGQWPPLAEAVAGCACVLAGGGRLREAALALGGAERLMQRLDLRFSPWIRRRLDAAYAVVARQPHGPDLMRAGAQLTAEAIVQLLSANGQHRDRIPVRDEDLDQAAAERVGGVG